MLSALGPATRTRRQSSGRISVDPARATRLESPRSGNQETFGLLAITGEGAACPRLTPFLVNVHLLASHRQRRLGHVLSLEYVTRGRNSLRMEFDVRHRGGWTGNLHPARE
jgi:hypothetical protein